MTFELVVSYPGDCLALLDIDVNIEGPNDWELNGATLLKLAPGGPVTNWQSNPRYDWAKLPALNIALDTIELADEYETEICDGINEQHRADADDRGDYLYEQAKDRRLGL
jgi:hypothetical protein